MVNAVSRNSANTVRFEFIDHLQAFLFALLTFLAFSIPVNLQPVKLALLLILLVISFFQFFNHKPSRSVLIVGLFYLLFAVPVSLIGIGKNNIGAMAFAKVELLYPLLLGLVVCTMDKKRAFGFVVKACAWAGIFIALYSFLLLLSGIGVISNFISLDDTSDVGLHSGYTHLTNTNLSMTIVVFPLVFLLSKQERKAAHMSTFLYIVSSVLTATAMAISGRRILWVVLAVCFVVFLFSKRFRTKSKVWLLVLALVSVPILFFYFNSRGGLNISWDSIWARFIEAFGTGKNEYGISGNVRYEQMDALNAGFQENVLIGAGGGALLSTYVRSASTPWIFEASYNMILYNSGIIFFTFYILAFLAMIIILLKARKKPYAIPVLFSLLLALVANATNPYFSGSFDFILFTIIPLLYINIYARSEPEVIKA